MSDEEVARAGETPLGDVVAVGALRPAAGGLVAVRSRVDATVEFDLRLTAGACRKLELAGLGALLLDRIRN